MYTQQEIKDKITTDARWAERAILALYARQTIDERAAEVTAYENGMGYNGVDAPLLSSFAKQLLNGRHLTVKQLAWAFKKLGKYASQLYSIQEESAHDHSTS